MDALEDQRQRAEQAVEQAVCASQRRWPCRTRTDDRMVDCDQEQDRLDAEHLERPKQGALDQRPPRVVDPLERRIDVGILLRLALPQLLRASLEQDRPAAPVSLRRASKNALGLGQEEDEHEACRGKE